MNLIKSIKEQEIIRQQLINNLRAEIERLQTELNSIRKRYAEAQINSNRYQALRNIYSTGNNNWFRVIKNPTTGLIDEIHCTKIDNVPSASYYPTIDEAVDAYLMGK